jgi:GNAT superfamily N-acetyltransferase
VNDLNVLPDFRNQGIGNALLDAIESTARDRSEVVGLGVGLYRDYGAAQKI